jgi:hypothetical protein
VEYYLCSGCVAIKTGEICVIIQGKFIMKGQRPIIKDAIKTLSNRPVCGLRRELRTTATTRLLLEIPASASFKA